MVAVPVGAYDRPWFCTDCRIMSLHTHIEPKQEIIEIEPQSKSVGSRYLLIKRFKLKHSLRLVGIIMDCPYISGIDEERALKNPEKLGTVFNAHVKAYVAALIYEVAHRISAREPSGTQGAHVPSTHSICSSSVETLLEWKDGGVTVRHTYSCAKMAGYGVAGVEAMEIRKVSINFGIL